MEVDDSVTALSMEPMEFFPHDALASQDIKCKKLLKRQGMSGYGRWWILCETLSILKGHFYYIRTDEELELLADTLDFTTNPECREFLDDLAEIGLIDKGAYKDGIVGSPRMMRNAEYMAKKRAAGKKAVQARERNRAERKKKEQSN